MVKRKGRVIRIVRTVERQIANWVEGVFGFVIPCFSPSARFYLIRK